MDLEPEDQDLLEHLLVIRPDFGTKGGEVRKKLTSKQQGIETFPDGCIVYMDLTMGEALNIQNQGLQLIDLNMNNQGFK